MAPLKWRIIVFLGAITLLGFPSTAESDASSKETKSSSASECRVHIEKALEQYWDQSDPSNKDHPLLDKTITTHSQEDDEENISVPETYDQSEEDEDEDEETVDDNDNNTDAEKDESDDEDDSVKDEIDKLENQDEDVEQDDEGSDDDEEDEDEEGEADDNEGNNDIDEKVEEHTAEEGVKEENVSTNTESQDDDSSSIVENTDNIRDGDNIDDDDDNDDDGDENNEVDDDNEDEEDGEEEPELNEHTLSDSNKTEDREDSDINKDDEESIEEEADEDEEEEEEDEEEELEDSKSEQSEDKIKIEIQIESDKVIGEADRTSAGMASEFHDEKSSTEQSQATECEEKILNASTLEDEKESDTKDEDESDTTEETETEQIDENDDTIENIYEEEEESTSGITYRSRDHIDAILGLDEIGTEYDNEEEKLAQNIYKEIKKIYQAQVKPIEMLFKYADSTTRVLGDAEIFNKPMLIFLGPWSAGKTTIINYLLGTERTPTALKTGTGITDTDFTIITYGETHRIRSGTELAAEWRYAGVQRFGQDFLDHFRGVEIPHTLLKKITIIDTPGILENKKNAERGYSLNDAFQWFIDRSDAIYVVLDPSKVDIGAELGSVVDQLKGRDARFLLNKADSIRRSDLMRVVGQLFWNLSPLMSSTEAPLIYAVSLTTKPFHPSAPAKFLADQEKNYFYDMKDTLDKRVENRILYARRHAVRVRNHAKMIDCYLATYYRHKSIFSSKRNVAKSIIDNPQSYNLFDGFGGMSNVSRYDLPDPTAYKEFFKLHPLYDFKPLASTCSYFRGCPMDKLDLAISKDIPELLAKYKKTKQIDSLKQNR